jgi:membrane associated rhomboid family serine protease
MREQRATMPKVKPQVLTRLSGSGTPVTYAIIAVSALVFILQSLPGIGGAVTSAIQYAGYYSYPGSFEPWRMITTVFAHASILHIALNMYTLWIFGTLLEPMLGRVRYLVLYLLSGLAGSVGVSLIASPGTAVVGASGAIFGMMGAFFVIQRRLGGNSTQLLFLVGINLVIGFIPGLGIAWQAHVGGLVGGALVGLIYMETRAQSRRNLQIGLLVVLAVVLVALSCVHLFV